MITVSTVFDIKKTATRKKAAIVYVRVTVDRRTIYISTGVSVKKGEWLQSGVCNRPDSAELQEKISIVEKRVCEYVNSAMRRGVPIRPEELKLHVWSAKERNAGTMLDWFEEQIPLLNIRESTRMKYRYTLEALRRYGRLMSWADLTPEGLFMLDAWLHSLPNRKSSMYGNERLTDAGVYNYHKNLKAMLNRALKFGKIQSNPYDLLKGEFRKGTNSNIEYLDEEEMAAIMAIRPIPGSQIDIARDLFVFQAYTGLAYTDAQSFDAGNYRKAGGKWVYSGRRAKTGVPYTGQLLPPVVAVLEKYGWKVPRMDNSVYNKCLKAVALAAGINRRLHSHMARHTFATWALNSGVSIENVGQMLGQKNIVTTQLYAKVLAGSVQSDFDMLSRKIIQK